MSIELHKSIQSDLDYVRDNPIDPAVTKNFMNLKITGWARTAVFDGNIMGVGGVVTFWPGVGEGWYCLSKHCEHNKLAMITCIEDVIDEAIKDLKLHRLQSTVRKDFTKAIKLLEHIGFVNETPEGMKYYTQDKIDAYLYAYTID